LSTGATDYNEFVAADLLRRSGKRRRLEFFHPMRPFPTSSCLPTFFWVIALLVSSAPGQEPRDVDPFERDDRRYVDLAPLTTDELVAALRVGVTFDELLKVKIGSGMFFPWYNSPYGMWIATKNKPEQKCKYKEVMVLFGPTNEVPAPMPDDGSRITAVVGFDEFPLDEKAKFFYILPRELAGKRATGLHQHGDEWTRKLVGLKPDAESSE
jgi:hypothetical protein